MAGSKLEVGIGADISDFSKKIKEVEYDLKELSKAKVERIKLGLDTGEINAQIKDVKNTLRDLQTTSKDTGAALGSTGGAMNNFGKQTANGGSALTAFSRIAQDAPYGIIGIGNNITNTAEQFGYLVKSTGSAGGAFKALASSLTGVGGVLLAVSLITTAFTVMSQQGLTVSDVINKLTGNVSQLSADLKNANQEAIKDTGKEVVNLKALVAIAQDDAESKRKRLAAVAELQKLYPAYFGNLKNEQILNGNVADSVNEVTKALIAKAVAEKLSDKSADQQLKLYKINALIIKAKDEVIKRENEFLSAAKSGSATTESLALSVDQAKNRVTELRNEWQSTNNQIGQYQKIINSVKSQSILLDEPVVKAGKKAPEVFNTPQVSGVESGLISAPLFDLNSVAVFNGQIDEFGNKVKSLPGVISTSMSFVSGSIVQPISDELIRVTELMMQFNESANILIQDSIASTFGNLGSVIGESLVTGGNVLAAIGTTILQGLANFLSDMGGLLIKYGTLAVIKGKLDLAILTGGPVAIGAGIAAIGIGIALKAAGGAIGALSTGRGNTSPATRGGSNSNFSTSSGGFSATNSGGGTVVFEIAGQKLVGVLSNTLNANRRLGGQLGL